MNRRRDGLWLALGAACTFLAWALMPDAATNDAAHILTAVAGARGRVHASALVQLAGAALLGLGLPGLARDERAGRAVPVVLTWGALGLAADAVFHQLAYQMTAPGVDRAAMLPIMQQMQTAELAPHVPLLLAFVAGAPILGWRLRRAGGGSRLAWLLLAPLVTIPLVVAAARLLELPRRIGALAVLAEVCAGLAAWGIASARRQP